MYDYNRVYSPHNIRMHETFNYLIVLEFHINL